MQQRVLTFQPYTQWETGIRSPASACGPTAASALLRFWEERLSVAGGAPLLRHRLPADPAEAVNRMYAACFGTPLGTGAPALAFALRRGLNARLDEAGLPGQAKTRRLSGFDAYRAEIDANRLVAVKFDKWFALRWRSRPLFDYHWTVGCGYRVEDDGTRSLIVHDAGARRKDGTYAPSRERLVPYEAHRPVLTMIALRVENGMLS
ncbi:hypothetical protein CDO73_08440 [Saccharibacillus sp. O23]|uniref:hypothetical protein n=1 Tax=Saccharibacillus sp. O23 TaxID=2009338 RepID=UPI000B4E07D8|nr:hypothetical protein [Saccharibacillus sp. O23]OWR31154.1 hypothetical protein CDO73_08440 [Saccharibacillus sp. O23]